MSYNGIMVKLLLLTLLLLLCYGCANKRGISMNYYNDCREYYDLQGTYRTVCDENLIEYGTPLTSTPSDTTVHDNVW